MKPKYSLRNLIFAGSALITAPLAMAQGPYYWDNNAVGGFGNAGGTWSAAASLWSTSSTGVGAAPGTILPNTSDVVHFGTDTATFGLGGGTISVGTVNAASLRFGSQTTSNVILSGGTITLAAVSSIHVGAGGTTVHTISSSIAGAGTSLTKTGNHLLLSGNNSYSGSTNISSGTLSLGHLNLRRV